MLWQWRGLNSGPCAHKTNILPLRWISNPKSFFSLKVEWWIRNHQLRPPQLVNLLTQPRSVHGTVYPIPTAPGPLPYICVFYSTPGHSAQSCFSSVFGVIVTPPPLPSVFCPSLTMPTTVHTWARMTFLWKLYPIATLMKYFGDFLTFPRRKVKPRNTANKMLPVSQVVWFITHHIICALMVKTVSTLHPYLQCSSSMVRHLITFKPDCPQMPVGRLSCSSFHISASAEPLVCAETSYP